MIIDGDVDRAEHGLKAGIRGNDLGPGNGGDADDTAEGAGDEKTEFMAQTFSTRLVRLMPNAVKRMSILWCSAA